MRVLKHQDWEAVYNHFVRYCFLNIPGWSKHGRQYAKQQERAYVRIPQGWAKWLMQVHTGEASSLGAGTTLLKIMKGPTISRQGWRVVGSAGLPEGLENFSYCMLRYTRYLLNVYDQAQKLGLFSESPNLCLGNKTCLNAEVIARLYHYLSADFDNVSWRQLLPMTTSQTRHSRIIGCFIASEIRERFSLSDKIRTDIISTEPPSGSIQEQSHRYSDNNQGFFQALCQVFCCTSSDSTADETTSMLRATPHAHFPEHLLNQQLTFLCGWQLDGDNQIVADQSWAQWFQEKYHLYANPTCLSALFAGCGVLGGAAQQTITATILTNNQIAFFPLNWAQMLQMGLFDTVNWASAAGCWSLSALCLFIECYTRANPPPERYAFLNPRVLHQGEFIRPQMPVPNSGEGSTAITEQPTDLPRQTLGSQPGLQTPAIGGSDYVEALGSPGAGTASSAQYENIYQVLDSGEGSIRITSQPGPGSSTSGDYVEARVFPGAGTASSPRYQNPYDVLQSQGGYQQVSADRTYQQLDGSQ